MLTNDEKIVGQQPITEQRIHPASEIPFSAAPVQFTPSAQLIINRTGLWHEKHQKIMSEMIVNIVMLHTMIIHLLYNILFKLLLSIFLLYLSFILILLLCLLSCNKTPRQIPCKCNCKPNKPDSDSNSDNNKRRKERKLNLFSLGKV